HSLTPVDAAVRSVPVSFSRAGDLPDLHSFPTRRSSDLDLRRMVHRTVQRVTQDIEERFHFNTAISAIMELVNAFYLYKESGGPRSEEHTSELQSRENLVCRLLLEKKKNNSAQSMAYRRM